MASSAGFPIRLRILLPLLAAAAMMLSTRANGIVKPLEGMGAALGVNQYASAARYQLDLLKWEPWRVELWQPAGRLALWAGDVDLAVSSLEQGHALGVLNDEGRLLLGETYWRREQKEQAVAAWQPLIDQGKAPADVYQRIVDYRRSLKNIAMAGYIAGIWQENYPLDGRAAWNEGLLSLPLDWKKARAALLQVVKLDPSHKVQVRVLLDALVGDDLQVPVEYRLVQIGRSLGAIGEWDLALDAFERAKEANSQYAEAWAFNSEALQRLNRDGKADLERALQLAPESAAVQALAGLNFRRSDDPQQALPYFLKAAQLEPRQAIWQIEIGNTYADLHNLQKGLEFYQKAAAFVPDDPSYWRLITEYCLNHGYALRDTGLGAARQALVLDSQDAENLDLMGQVLLALEDESSAERFLQQAIDKNSDFPAAYLHLGQLYLRQARMDWAEYYLAQASRMSAQDEDISLLAHRLLMRYFGLQ